MNTVNSATRYKNHRFPTEIISHAVWLYFRFCLSFRDVEELLSERGVIVTYEAIRKWCRKFGQQYANQLRHRRPRPGDKWHSEMCQTHPIKMPWCPLSLLRQRLSNRRGGCKRENEMDGHLCSRDDDFADQAAGDGLPCSQRARSEIFTPPWRKGSALSITCCPWTLWGHVGPHGRLSCSICCGDARGLRGREQAVVVPPEPLPSLSPLRLLSLKS